MKVNGIEDAWGNVIVIVIVWRIVCNSMENAWGPESVNLGLKLGLSLTVYCVCPQIYLVSSGIYNIHFTGV